MKMLLIVSVIISLTFSCQNAKTKSTDEIIVNQQAAAVQEQYEVKEVESHTSPIKKKVINAVDIVALPSPPIRDSFNTSTVEKVNKNTEEGVTGVENNLKEPKGVSIAEQVTNEETKIEEPKPNTEIKGENSEEIEGSPAEEKTDPVPQSHESFDVLLQKYVSADGKVNYKGFKADRAKLQTYIDDLSANPPTSDAKRAEKMAYWINLYNAVTIDLIVDNYPVKSIIDLAEGKPWDLKLVTINGKPHTLNDIEHKILRPIFKDPRIHFAVNCAAKSCPKVNNRAWTKVNLESNLEKQSKAFVNNTNANQISASELKLSKIFDWYGGDFSDLNAFISKYASTSINKDAKITFIDYDWTLNEN